MCPLHPSPTIPSPSRPKVTLMLVTWNEIHGLRDCVPKLDRNLIDQVLVLDGGSTDGTVGYCLEQGFEVYVQEKRGIRKAYEEVWPMIRGEIVILFAPDGGSVPEKLDPLIRKMGEGFDMVIVSRYKDDAKSEEDDAVTAFGNWLFNTLINLLHGGRYTDCMVMYRALRTSLPYELDLFSESSYQPMERACRTVSSIEPLMSVRAAHDRLKVDEIPGDEPDRLGGERKLQVWRWGAVYLLQVLREVIWRPKADKSYPLSAPDPAAARRRVEACLAVEKAPPPVPAAAAAAPARRGRRLEFAALAGILALSSLALLFQARQVFDFFDMSGFLDAGYRVFRGQRPYLDFQYVAGPVHLWMHALSFALFGFTQSAVLAHLLAVNAAATLAVYALSRDRVPVPLALAVSAVSSITFAIPIAHPWYDQNAYLWFLAALALLPVKGRALPARSAAAGALVVLSIFTKTNIGGAAALAVAGVILCGPSPLRMIAAYAGGMLAALLLLTRFFDVHAFVDQTLLAYRPESRLHALPVMLFHAAVSTPYGATALGGAVVLAKAGLPWLRAHQPEWAILLGVLFTGTVGLVTGSMRPHANFALAGAALALLCAVGWEVIRRPSVTRVRPATVAAWMACSAVLMAGVLGLSVWRAGFAWTWNPYSTDRSYELKTESFRGWNAHPRLGEGTDLAVQAVRDRVPASASLLILPHGTWIYGLAGRMPYAPAPFLFHEGKMPPPGRWREEVRRAWMEHPPDWILLHGYSKIDFSTSATVMRDLGLGDWLARGYRIDRSWDRWRLLRRKEPGEPPEDPQVFEPE